jgi:IrrE N-terminal-like domain
MTPHYNSASRAARRGKGVLPPNPKQWDAEHNALDLRAELELSLEEPLAYEAAFQLLPAVTVLPHGAIPAAEVHLATLRRNGGASWSGMAFACPSGDEFVVYNDAHSLARVRATLMEEFFHLRLGHPRSTLRLLSGSEATRSYDRSVEQEAYDSGAAALVPYATLKKMLGQGCDPSVVAEHFGVSTELVVFRGYVTRAIRRKTK